MRRTRPQRFSARLITLPTEPVGASTLEIRRPAESYDGTFTDQRACGIECRTLLSTGQARWVRVVEVKQFTAQTLTSSTFHRALHGKECAAPGSKLNDSAVCVVDVADPGDPANLVIDVINPIGSEASLPLSPFATVVRKRAVVVRTGNTDQADGNDAADGDHSRDAHSPQFVWPRDPVGAQWRSRHAARYLQNQSTHARRRLVTPGLFPSPDRRRAVPAGRGPIPDASRRQHDARDDRRPRFAGRRAVQRSADGALSSKNPGRWLCQWM